MNNLYLTHLRQLQILILKKNKISTFEDEALLLPLLGSAQCNGLNIIIIISEE